MPRSPSPRPEYSRRSHGRPEYRERESYRERDFAGGYRDLDRPPEEERRRSRSRSPGRDRDRKIAYERRERNSRSPPHPRERERHRERERRDRHRSPDRSRYNRSRSRSPNRRDRGPLSPRTSERERRDSRHDRDNSQRDSRSSSPKKEEGEASPGALSSNPLPNIDPDEDPEQAMMALMGIGGFVSTKGKKVSGNEISAVNIKKQRQYRQYMNRRGGFNRPLDKVQ